MKKLSMLLALCLLMTALPAATFAEGLEALSQTEEMPIEAGLSDWNDDPEETVPEFCADDGLLPSEADPEDAELCVGEIGTALILSNAAPEAAEQAEDPEGPILDAPTPHADPNGPRLAATELALGAGERFELSPALPEGVEGAIALTTSDPAVATVTPEGTVAAVAVGEACVTATAEGGAYTECFVHVKKAPDRVSFNLKKLNVGKGEITDALQVTVGSAEGEYAGAYTFSSSKTSVARVNAQGAVKGVKTGTATIKVKTYNGKTASCKVTVLSAPKKVTAAVDKKLLGVGETARMTCTLPKNTASRIAYASDAPGIAAVDPVTGVVTGVGPGKTKIWARAFNGKKSAVTVTVAPAPRTLAFDADSLRLGVGMKLTVKAHLDDGAAGTIAYSIQDRAVAACSGDTVKGVAAGSTTLVARTYNGLTAQCPVEVTEAPKSVKLPWKTLNIAVGQKLRLTPDVGSSASTFTYATSNRKIVAVSAEGVLKGVKKGSATVTVKTYNKKTFKLKVNVMKAATAIRLSPASLDLGVDETATLAYSLPGNTAAAVTFTCDDETVARVDPQTGAVTGVAPGKATVTATTHNGKTASAAVTVYAGPEWIRLSDTLIEIAEDQSFPLGIELSPGSRSPLVFTSQDKRVATVSDVGVVTGEGAGSTKITVETNTPGVSAEAYVTVKPAPRSVKLGKAKLSLNVGETTQMVPVIDAGAMTTFEFKSSNEAVATVTEEGMVTALAKGSAILTVTTHNALSAAMKLTVLDPWYPESVELTNVPDTMAVGERIQLLWTTKPEGAVADLEWTSSKPSVAEVDEAGVLSAYSYGYTKITAVSRRNSEIILSFTVGVETNNVVLTIPARTTGVSGIAANLAKIDAIRVSAINQINQLKSGGVISAADASKRASIINNAFKDYSFPWITLKKQSYWKAENSEGGVKDFKPDRVYYGMPYISGSGNNRAYNAAKALNEGRYYDSGEGYYILNQNKLLSGKYCGNDCSCFVDAAIWGTGSSHSHDRTADIAVSSAYKTISDFKAMRTGDLINKGAAHVVLFLYYVNAEKTKIMIIENGGIEPGTNTVHCMVMNVSWYTSRGYKVRRLKTLG